MVTTQLASTLKQLRKTHGMTQEELAMKSGVGLRFIRDLEQGKPTLRLDKVNQVFGLFEYEIIAARKV